MEKSYEIEADNKYLYLQLVLLICPKEDNPGVILKVISIIIYIESLIVISVIGLFLLEDSLIILLLIYYLSHSDTMQFQLVQFIPRFLINIIMFGNGIFGFFAGNVLSQNHKNSKILPIIFLIITGGGFILFSYFVPEKRFDYLIQLRIISYGILIINLTSLIYLILKK